jgi:hypothetical protein
VNAPLVRDATGLILASAPASNHEILTRLVEILAPGDGDLVSVLECYFEVVLMTVRLFYAWRAICTKRSSAKRLILDGKRSWTGSAYHFFECRLALTTKSHFSISHEMNAFRWKRR